MELEEGRYGKYGILDAALPGGNENLLKTAKDIAVTVHLAGETAAEATEGHGGPIVSESREAQRSDVS